MKILSKEEKLNRIIARGEFSDHAHVVTGKCTIERNGDDVFINAEDGQATMRHLLESKYLAGKEQWTGEHEDIVLAGDTIRHGDVILKKVSKGRYQYIHQIEFDPFEDIIRKVRD